MILTSKGLPFATEKAAQLAAGKKRLKNYRIEAHEGGFGIVEDVTATPPEQPDEPTRKTTTPWKPAKMLHIPEHLKDPDFVYRFVDKEKTGNVRKKLSEGWLIDHDITAKLSALPKTLEDGAALDSTYQVRELVVMKMPKEMAAERNRHYSGLRTSDGAEQSFKNRVEGNATGKLEERRGG